MASIRSFLVREAALAVLCLLGTPSFGCGGGSAVAPPLPTPEAPPSAGEVAVHRRGEDKLIVEVGPAGGTLELADGARVEIPAGALAEPVQITFAHGAHTTAFENREGEKALGTPLDLTPSVKASAPLVVSIPLASLPEGYSDEDLALATEVLAEEQRDYQASAGLRTRWDYIQAKHAEGRAKAELLPVPGYRVQFVLSRPE